MASRRFAVLLLLIIADVQNVVECATFENVKVVLTTDYTRNIKADGQRPTFSLTIPSDNFLKNHVNNQLPSLESLVIVNQVIPVLTSNSIADLNTIERINITSSHVRIIDSKAFRNIPQLEMLIIEDNDIEVIKSGTFSHLTKLDWLSLKHNKISRIERGAFGDNLKHLELDHNKISTFHDDWIRQVTLSSLYMSYNLIEELPRKFMTGSGNKHIVMANIILNGNKIRKIDVDAFAGFQSIDYLKLSDNSIGHLPVGVFNGVEKIENLELDHNRIGAIPDGLFDTVNVTYVDLHGNLLKCVPIDALAKVYKFVVDDNPLTCDCVKRWEDWKREHNNDKIVNLESFITKHNNCQKE